MNGGITNSMAMGKRHSRLKYCDFITGSVPREGIISRCCIVFKCRKFGTSLWHSILEIPVCKRNHSGFKGWRITKMYSLFPAFCTIMVTSCYQLLARFRRLLGEPRMNH